MKELKDIGEDFWEETKGFDQATIMLIITSILILTFDISVFLNDYLEGNRLFPFFSFLSMSFILFLCAVASRNLFLIEKITGTSGSQVKLMDSGKELNKQRLKALDKLLSNKDVEAKEIISATLVKHKVSIYFPNIDFKGDEGLQNFLSGKNSKSGLITLTSVLLTILATLVISISTPEELKEGVNNILSNLDTFTIRLGFIFLLIVSVIIVILQYKHFINYSFLSLYKSEKNKESYLIHYCLKSLSIKDASSINSNTKKG